MQLLSDDLEDAIQSKRKNTIFDFQEANSDGGRHGVSEIERGISFQLCESDRGIFTRRELHCCVLLSRRREKLIENSPLIRCRLFMR